MSSTTATTTDLPGMFPTSLTTTGLVCPECRDGKCRNCDGCAWDLTTDQPTNCACSFAGH